MPTSVETRRRDTGRTVTRCRNCDAHVSPRFARVFGDNDDEIYCCLECSTFRDLQEGAGSSL